MKEEKKKDAWSKSLKKRKLDKSNMVAVVFKRNNGNADLLHLPVKNGFFDVGGKVCHERRDCTHIIKLGKERYPLAIIQEWDIIPEGTKEWDEKEIREKAGICQDHIMKGIRHAERVRSGENMNDFKLNTKTMIVGAIIFIIIVAFLFSYV